jgi:hypothetical protein
MDHRWGTLRAKGFTWASYAHGRFTIFQTNLNKADTDRAIVWKRVGEID